MSVLRYHEVEPDYRCPRCSNKIVWSLANTRPGAKTSSHCTKHPTQSRVDFKPKSDFFCMWEGVARRTKSGEVELLDSDGKTRLRKR